MGPPITGSTSIQFQSRNSIKDLNKDGYDMPWVVANKKNGENQVNFATCFLSYREHEKIEKHPCDNNLLHSGNEIARQKHNLFVSSEALSRIDTDGLQMLSLYLSQWDRVTIVIFYRRYYD